MTITFDDDDDGGEDLTKVSHLSVMFNFAHHDFHMININIMHLVVTEKTIDFVSNSVIVEGEPLLERIG